MTELSDYKRMVEGPNNRAYEASITSLRERAEAAEAERDRLLAFVAAAREAVTLIGASLDKDFGLWSSPSFNGPRAATWAAYKRLSGALVLADPTLSEGPA